MSVSVYNSPKRSVPYISNGVFGTLIFVLTEVMFFTALVSAYLVIKSTKGQWVPPHEIRLPILATVLNTGVLFLSGFLLYRAGRLWNDHREKAFLHLIQATALGCFFCFFQGYEWIQLISHGMTMHSGIFAASFYLLIGTHGLHALAGVLVLFWAIYKVYKKQWDGAQMTCIQIFWFFVVGIWPILFGLVYF